MKYEKHAVECWGTLSTAEKWKKVVETIPWKPSFAIALDEGFVLWVWRCVGGSSEDFPFLTVPGFKRVSDGACYEHRICYSPARGYIATGGDLACVDSDFIGPELEPYVNSEWSDDEPVFHLPPPEFWAE
jgi:hypothetical protein